MGAEQSDLQLNPQLADMTISRIRKNKN